MNTTTNKTLRIVATILMVALAAIGVSACSQRQLASFVTGKTPYHPSYLVVETDTSGSTASQTVLGGAYEQEIMAALEQSARTQATVYASPIDGNSVADSAWMIDAATLRSSAGGGNPQLAEAARIVKAKHLRPHVRALLRTRPTNGSDILGALQRVAQLGRNLPAGNPKTLVLLTDGAINLSRFGGYDVYTTPPDTPAERHAVIAGFKRSGELPRLSGWSVYLGGIGVGIGNRTTARGVIALWEELLPAMGAHLAEINSTLTFTGR